jgi:hypothetical protein
MKEGIDGIYDITTMIKGKRNRWYIYDVTTWHFPIIEKFQYSSSRIIISKLCE